MNSIKCLGALTALGMAAMVVASPARAADLSIDVSSAFITSQVDRAISDYIRTSASKFDWLNNAIHIETTATGTSDTSLHLQLRLSYETVIYGVTVYVPVTLDFDVLLDCGEGGPYALIDNVVLKLLGQYPNDVAKEIQSAGNRMIAAKTREIVDPIWNQLGSLGDPQIANVHQVCPHFEVRSSGDIHAEVDFLRGCINYRRKHRACGARYWGSGFDYQCVNGYWERIGGWCERSAPPGGVMP